MEVKTKYAVSAFIDLLGFSSHLAMASNDTRTAIGQMAVKRLQNLDEAFRMIDSEFIQFPELYPSEKIHKQRFNDSLILTVELDEIIETSLGDSVWRGVNLRKLKELEKASSGYVEKGYVEEGYFESTKNPFEIQLNNISKFVGLIARIHAELNILENRDNHPGARTVISFGQKLSGDSPSLDAFSANFSISNCYLANEAGSKAGFKGNGFFIDDNVLSLISCDRAMLPLLVSCNFRLIRERDNPFEVFPENDIRNYLKDRKFKIEQANEISIELFKKEYVFREVNFHPLSWLQIKLYIDEYIDIEKMESEFDKDFYGNMSKIPDDKIDMVNMSDNPQIFTMCLLANNDIPNLNKYKKD